MGEFHVKKGNEKLGMSLVDSIAASVGKPATNVLAAHYGTYKGKCGLWLICDSEATDGEYDWGLLYLPIDEYNIPWLLISKSKAATLALRTLAKEFKDKAEAAVATKEMAGSAIEPLFPKEAQEVIKQILNTYKLDTEGLSGSVSGTYVSDSTNFQLKPKDGSADKSSDSKKAKGNKMDYSPVEAGVSATGKATLLKDARRLYAPVLGTSPGSRYLLIAANEEVQVAARWKGHSIAVRVEAADNTYDSYFKANGLDKKEAGHWSLHVSNYDSTLLWKSIGSILFGLGVVWETGYPLRYRVEGGGK